MMKYMPLMMVLFMYNYSSGLALYWTVSNLLTILQTKLTKTKPAGRRRQGPGAGCAAEEKEIIDRTDLSSNNRTN